MLINILFGPVSDDRPSGKLTPNEAKRKLVIRYEKVTIKYFCHIFERLYFITEPITRSWQVNLVYYGAYIYLRGTH